MEEWEKKTLFIGHGILETWTGYYNLSFKKGMKREQVEILGPRWRELGIEKVCV
jgi:hypothetical protein